MNDIIARIQSAPKGSPAYNAAVSSLYKNWRTYFMKILFCTLGDAWRFRIESLPDVYNHAFLYMLESDVFSKFDPSLGSARTYVGNAFKFGVNVYMDDCMMPRNQGFVLGAKYKAQKELDEQGIKSPSLTQIAQTAGCSEGRILGAMLLENPKSLDEPFVQPDGETTDLHEVIPAQENEYEEEFQRNEKMWETIAAAAEGLDAPSRAAVREIYDGTWGDGPGRRPDYKIGSIGARLRYFMDPASNARDKTITLKREFIALHAKMSTAFAGEAAPTEDEILGAMEHLSPDVRGIIDQHYFQGQTYLQIGAQNNTTRANAHIKCKKAEERLVNLIRYMRKGIAPERLHGGKLTKGVLRGLEK